MDDDCCGIREDRVTQKFQLERLNSFLSDLGRRLMPSVAVPKACFSRIAKKIPNKVGARIQPFHPTSKVYHVEP